MNREGVISTSFTIERLNQIKLFQVRIPREAKNIIGIELGMKWLSGAFPAPELPGTIPGFPGPPPPPLIWPPETPVGSMPMLIRRNQLMGELKFQSYEKANIFYTSELVIDQNMGVADFTAAGFAPKVYSHQKEKHEDQAIVNADSRILQGVFRHKLTVAGTFQYKVFVYVWVEVKEDQSSL